MPKPYADRRVFFTRGKLINGELVLGKINGAKVRVWKGSEHMLHLYRIPVTRKSWRYSLCSARHDKVTPTLALSLFGFTALIPLSKV